MLINEEFLEQVNPIAVLAFEDRILFFNFVVSGYLCMHVFFSKKEIYSYIKICVSEKKLV